MTGLARAALFLGLCACEARPALNATHAPPPDPPAAIQAGPGPAQPAGPAEPGSPASAPVEASAVVAAPLPHDDARRLELARALGSERGWNLFESPSWFLATPVDDPLLVEGAKLRLEAVRARLRAALPPRRAGTHHDKPLVRLYASRADFEAAGGQRGTSGFWSAPERTLAVYDARGDERATTTWPALQHVAVHAYLDDELGLARVPPWFLYGVAARYESLRYRELRSGGAALLEAPPETERARLAEAVERAGPMPLEALLAFDRQEFFGANDYASGGFRNLVLAHAFVRFLAEERPAAGAADELEQVRVAFLGVAFAALQEGLDGDEAVTRARGLVTAAALDAAWRAWIERETGRPLPAGP